MNGVAVACRGLTKRFGGPSGVVAVGGLDLDVPAGSVFGLLGPNGAGKTTTLRLITGLARPTAGSASIDGTPVDPRDPGARRSIGVLDQEPRYYGWMTGRELVAFAGRLQGLTTVEARDRAGPTLERVGLAEAAGRRIAGYSGGMRQRLGIAQALVADPDLLILDEPVSSRPRGSARPVGAHRGAPRPGDDHLLDPCPGRCRTDLRSRRDPGPRPTRDRGAA